MLTTCPECHTTFRVAHDQLETRRGLVRCGYCRAVFNAYDTLLPEFESPNAAEAEETSQSALPGEAPIHEALPPVESAADAEQEATSGFDALPGFEPLPEPHAQDEPDEEPEAPAGQAVAVGVDIAGEPQGEVDPFHEVGGQIPRLSLYDEIAGQGGEETAAPGMPPLLLIPETSDSILLSELPTRARLEPGAQPWKTVLLVLFGLLLALILAAQAAYFFRAFIVQWQPSLRPAFEQVCQDLGCKIPLSREIGLLKVESSSLETDQEQPNRAKLKVSFSNRASQAQAWPCFVLRLSDVQGTPLAQRVFWPKDYLPKGKNLKDGVPPMSEQVFTLDLDLTGLNASGYEVKPRYP